MKYGRSIAVIIIFAALLAALAACDGNAITALSSKTDSVTVRLGGKFDAADYIVSDGDGKIYYAVENSSVVSIDGSVVTAEKVGEAAVIASSGGLSAKIKITVVDDRTVDIGVADNTVTYDGGTYNVTLSGVLPLGSSVSYFLADGTPFSGASDAGVYSVGVTVEVPEEYNLVFENRNAVLTINKASYDLGGVSFPAREYTYDGSEKTVTLLGELPNGVTVTYENNTATDAGTYYAKAVFSQNDKNYNDISDMTCKIVIAKRFFYLAANGFADISATYDKKAHSAAIEDLPEGVSAEYYYDDGGTMKSLGGGFTGAGSYTQYARLTANASIEKNYSFVTDSEIVNFTEKDGVFVSDYVGISIKIARADLSCTARYAVRDINGDAVTQVYYGKKIDFGERSDGYYLVSLEGELPLGVDSEFAGLVSVVYDYPTETNDLGFLDANDYTVKARFILPDSYTENYNAIADKIYTLTVNRAVYDMSGIVFTCDEPSAVYSETAVYSFAARNFDASEVAVNYTYRYDGASMGTFDGSKIKHAGNYVVYANFSLLLSDKADYEPLNQMSLAFTVTPVSVPMDGVAFADKTAVYDGEAHSVGLSGTLADGVTVKYTSGGAETNSFTNAGSYAVTAKFYYKNWDSRDYAVYIGGKAVTELSSKFVISKADYDSPDLSAFVQDKIPTYSRDLRLSDIGFINNADGFVAWLKPDTAVSVSEVDGENGYFTATAVYNADKSNYNDYHFAVTVTVKRAVIDFACVAVNEQFVAYTGLQTVPAVLYSGTDYSDDITVSAVSADGSPAVETGDYTVNVTLSPLSEKNYFVKNGKVYENVLIHIYNRASYSYEAGTCTLLKYVGAAKIVSVPENTKIIAQNAFDGTSVTDVTLPDSADIIAVNAFGTVSSLASLSLPTVVFSGAGSLAKMFCGVSVPRSLSTVTVRNDTTVKAGFFTNANYIETVKYSSEVTDIEAYAFDNCAALEYFYTKNYDGIIAVGEGAFRACFELKDLTVPNFGGNTAAYYFGSAYISCKLENLTFTSTESYSLAENALKGMSSLVSLNFSSGLTGLGANCLCGISAPIDLSATSVTALGMSAFNGYKGTLVTLPQNLTAIGSYAFANASALGTLTVPKNVSAIGAHAFDGCSAALTFSDGSVYSAVADYAFYGYLGASFDFSRIESAGKHSFENSSLKTVSLNIDVAESAFAGCASLEAVVFGAAVSEIGDFAFENCMGLTSVDIPSTVGGIGVGAFKGAASVTEVRFSGITPPVFGENSFLTGGGVVTVRVPSSAFGQYRDTFNGETTVFDKYGFNLVGIN